jgi:hypothetical protein
MRASNTITWLVFLIAVLAFFAAGIGLFYQDGGKPFTFVTLHSSTVQIYGQGLYRFDTPLIAVGYRIADAVTLILSIPLLVVSLVLCRRGSLNGVLMLTGVLAHFCYNYGSLALGAAYNNLFLVYLAVFSASLFALIMALMAIDSESLAAQFSPRFPRRALGIYLIVSGIALCVLWIGLSVLPALLQNQAPPELASYTTIITFVVDLAVIAPCMIVAGRLLMQQAPLGYLFSSTLLVFTDVLGISLLVMGIAQEMAGLLNIGQFIGFVVSFAILTFFALMFTIIVFRDIATTGKKSIIVEPSKGLT